MIFQSSTNFIDGTYFWKEVSPNVNEVVQKISFDDKQLILLSSWKKFTEYLDIQLCKLNVAELFSKMRSLFEILNA